jgi:hypothetical protein
LNFVSAQLIMLFRRLLQGLPHSGAIKRAGNPPAGKIENSRGKTVI